MTSVERILTTARRMAVASLGLEAVATLAAIIVFEFAASEETSRLFDSVGSAWAVTLRVLGVLYVVVCGVLGYAVIRRAPIWTGFAAAVRSLVALSGCTYLCLLGYWAYAAVAVPALVAFMLLGLICTAA